MVPPLPKTLPRAPTNRRGFPSSLNCSAVSPGTADFSISPSPRHDASAGGSRRSRCLKDGQVQVTNPRAKGSLFLHPPPPSPPPPPKKKEHKRATPGDVWPLNLRGTLDPHLFALHESREIFAPRIACCLKRAHNKKAFASPNDASSARVALGRLNHCWPCQSQRAGFLKKHHVLNQINGEFKPAPTPTPPLPGFGRPDLVLVRSQTNFELASKQARITPCLIAVWASGAHTNTIPGTSTLDTCNLKNCRPTPPPLQPKIEE